MKTSRKIFPRLSLGKELYNWQNVGCISEIRMSRLVKLKTVAKLIRNSILGLTSVKRQLRERQIVFRDGSRFKLDLSLPAERKEFTGTGFKLIFRIIKHVL